MAQIVLTIPDAVLPRVVDAIAVKFDYTANKLESETKAQFAKRMLAVTVKQWVKDGEIPPLYAAVQQNQRTLEADIDANVSIT